MAIITFDESGTPARTGGRIRRALRWLTSARETRTPRRVEDYLLLLDDARLATFAIERRAASNDRNGKLPW